MSTKNKWLEDLDDSDKEFIKKFILASGSLKEMANEYNVTYPTVRLRLDRLIAKVKASLTVEDDEYVSLIKKLVLENKLDFEVAKVLITQYRKEV